MSAAIELADPFPHAPEADSFDFRRSWAGVRRACAAHRALIALTCVLTIGLTTLYLMLWPPVYTATVELIGESDKDYSREGFYSNWAAFRKEQLGDEVQMFMAAPVLAEVIHRLGLTYPDVYHPFLSHLGYLWTTSPPGRAWRFTKDLILPHTPGRYEPTKEQVEFARTLNDFKAGVRLDQVMETDLGKLTVRGPSPRVAEIANTIVAVYFEQRRVRHTSEAEDAYNALEAELRRTRDELDESEQRMRKYYSENDLMLTFEKDKVDIGRLETMQAGLNNLRATIAAGEQTLATIDAQLATESRNVVANSVTAVNPIRDQLRAKLAELQVSRRQTLIHYRADSPEVADIDRQIAAFSDQLAHEPERMLSQTTTVLSANYESLRSRKSQLEADLAGQRASLAVQSEATEQLRHLLDTIPEKMRVVHDMDREHEMLEKKYGAIDEKLMIAAVSRATAQSAPATIRVVESAEPPSKPSWPKPKLLLLVATVFGAGAGVALAMLADLLFGRVHRHALAGDIPLYAVVGRDSAFAGQLFHLPARDGNGRRGWLTRAP